MNSRAERIASPSSSEAPIREIAPSTVSSGNRSHRYALEEPDRPPAPARSGKVFSKNSLQYRLSFPSVTETAYRFSRVTASGTFALRKKISSTSIRW